jgi:alpha-beta hydrolase superfamily lysophospholipase
MRLFVLVKELRHLVKTEREKGQMMTHNEFGWQVRKGLEIYVQEWSVEAPRGVVALVHGLGEHSGRYKHVAQVLNQAGYAMIGFDLPGHGKSEGKRGHSSAGEIFENIDRLLLEAGKRGQGAPRFLYGHSMGGNLVLGYAQACHPPIQGVIATSPGLATGEPVPGWKMAIVKTMGRFAPAVTVANGLDRENLSRDPSVIQAYNSDPLVHDQISSGLGFDLLKLGQSTMARAADFPLPLLLVQATGDHIVSGEMIKTFADSVPTEKVTYKVWDGLFHETHNEPEKEEVLRYMVGWMDSKL